MGGLEPDVQDFLKRIIKTMSATALFLLLHVSFGIYFNWAFFQGTPRLGNIVYYFVFFISLAALIYYYYKLWKDKL